VPGVVTSLAVKVSAKVKAGDPLFQLDERSLRAQLAEREAALAVAEARLAQLKAGPRPEELPVAEARVVEAQANLGDARNRLEMLESVSDKRGVSEEEVRQARFASKAADARVRQAQSDLALLKAGAWEQEILVAEAEVQSARAQREGIQTELERLTVRAPVDGQVLQVNLRPGEYAVAGASQTPLLVLGNTDVLHVRVDVDEHDAWRVQAGAPAEAFVRGNGELKTALNFVRFEPYVIPKKSLTGQSLERVDTRVLQVIYAFDPATFPVYVGQQVDVFIKGEPRANNTAPAPSVIPPQQG
jgi:multidrug resistance efflux pump